MRCFWCAIERNRQSLPGATRQALPSVPMVVGTMHIIYSATPVQLISHQRIMGQRNQTPPAGELAIGVLFSSCRARQRRQPEPQPSGLNAHATLRDRRRGFPRCDAAGVRTGAEGTTLSGRRTGAQPGEGRFSSQPPADQELRREDPFSRNERQRSGCSRLPYGDLGGCGPCGGELSVTAIHRHCCAGC